MYLVLSIVSGVVLMILRSSSFLSKLSKITSIILRPLCLNRFLPLLSSVEKSLSALSLKKLTISMRMTPECSKTFLNTLSYMSTILSYFPFKRSFFRMTSVLALWLNSITFSTITPKYLSSSTIVDRMAFMVFCTRVEKSMSVCFFISWQMSLINPLPNASQLDKWVFNFVRATYSSGILYRSFSWRIPLNSGSPL